MEEKEEITVNGQEVSKEEFDKIVESQDKNTKVIKESEDNYKLRLND